MLHIQWQKTHLVGNRNYCKFRSFKPKLLGTVWNRNGLEKSVVTWNMNGFKNDDKCRSGCNPKLGYEARISMVLLDGGLLDWKSI